MNRHDVFMEDTADDDPKRTSRLHLTKQRGSREALKLAPAGIALPAPYIFYFAVCFTSL